jgi:hypothetical protein
MARYCLTGRAGDWRIIDEYGIERVHFGNRARAEQVAQLLTNAAGRVAARPVALSPRKP